MDFKNEMQIIAALLVEANNKVVNLTLNCAGSSSEQFTKARELNSKLCEVLDFINNEIFK